MQHPHSHFATPVWMHPWIRSLAGLREESIEVRATMCNHVLVQRVCINQSATIVLLLSHPGLSCALTGCKHWNYEAVLGDLERSCVGRGFWHLQRPTMVRMHLSDSIFQHLPTTNSWTQYLVFQSIGSLQIPRWWMKVAPPIALKLHPPLPTQAPW